MVTGNELLSIVIPQRLDAIATLNLVLRLRTKWDSPKPMKIYFADRLQITGSSSAFTNPAIEAGLVHCRALLEFLGLCERDGTLSNRKGRRPDDIGIELFRSAN